MTSNLYTDCRRQVYNWYNRIIYSLEILSHWLLLAVLKVFTAYLWVFQELFPVKFKKLLLANVALSCPSNVISTLINTILDVFTARKIFRKVLFLTGSVLCTLSLEWLNWSQPNFHTKWRGGMTQILLKMGIAGLTIWRPSWKMAFLIILCFLFMQNG